MNNNKLISLSFLLLAFFTSSAQVILSEDFEGVTSGAVTSISTNSIYQDASASSGSGCDANDTWEVEDIDDVAGDVDDVNGSGNIARVEFGSSSCTQDVTLIIGSFTAGQTDVQISFAYHYNNFNSDLNEDFFEVHLYNETDGAQEQELLRLYNADQIADFNSTVTGLSDGDEYSLRFRYNGVYDYGVSIDNIQVEALCPVATITQEACQSDLTYDVTLNITNLNGFDNLTFSNSSGDLQTGISSTGEITYSNQTGDHTYSLKKAGVAVCDIDTLIEDCSLCDVIDTSFSIATCANDLTYSVDVTLTTIPITESVKIVEGISGDEKLIGLNSAGVYSIAELSDSSYIQIIDENDPTCIIERRYGPCSVCDFMNAEFLEQDCEPGEIYNVNFKVGTYTATSGSFYITNSDTTYHLGSDERGTYVIEDVFGAQTFEVIDNNGNLDDLWFNTRQLMKYITQ